MRNESILYLAVAVLVTACAITPAHTQARQSFNIQFAENADRCADVQVRSDGKTAQSAETFSVAKSAAAPLAINGAEAVNIRAIGWDKPDYSVEACKIVAAADTAAANRILQSVGVSHSGGRFSATGPTAAGERWIVVFIVHAPKGAALDLETHNGPLSARDIDGSIKARTGNGPLAIRNCAGTVEAHAGNGPIAFTGNGGDVRLSAENGPITLSLSGENWSGPQLEARTVNGPLRASIPAAFRTATRVETSSGPLNCSMDACRGARTDATAGHRVLEMNGANPTVRLSTVNGPLSVGPGKGTRGVI